MKIKNHFTISLNIRDRNILLSVLIKYSILLTMALLLVSSLIFTILNTLSQHMGLLAFLILCLSIILIIASLFHDKGASLKESPQEPVESGITNRYSFFLSNAIAATILILLSLRLVIFSNPVTQILNSNPPFFNSFWEYSFNILSGYQGNSQGFIVQSFYSNLLSFLPFSTGLLVKISFVFEFYFYYFLACSVSLVLYRVVAIRRITPAVFSIFFSYLFLANFIFRSEGFSSFIVGPIMFAYVIIKFWEQAKYRKFSSVDAVSVGLATAFGIFGDPRMLVYFFLLTLSIIVLSPLYGLLRKNFVFLIKTYLVVLPLFGIMYFITSFVPFFQANGGRAGNISTIAAFSSGTQPMYIFNFLANWWSNFVAAPPTVIFTGLGRYNFMPTLYAGNAIAVVPSGPLTILWSVSLTMVSIFAVMGIYLLYIHRANRSALIVVVGFAMTFLLTLGTNIGFKPLIQLYAVISTLPIIGPFWAVTISTPQFIDQYLSSYLIVFTSAAVLILSEYNRENIHRGHSRNLHIFWLRIRHNRMMKYIPLLFVLSMFLFANWQFLDPSYSLGQAIPGELPGNSVGNVSYLTPVTPPPGWLETYQKMYPTENLTYSVYSNDGYANLLKWDHGFNIGDSPGTSPNPEFVTLFNRIMNYNESWLLPTLMQEFGVKYIFFDKTQVHPDWSILSFLNYSGLPSYQNASADLFYTDNSSEISGSPYLFSAGGFTNQDILNLTYLLHSAGYYAALSPSNGSGISFTKDLGNASGTYISLSNISSMYPSRILPEMTGNYSGSSNADNFWIGNDWYVTRYNGGFYVNYSFNNGSLSVNRYSPSPENYNESSPPLFFLSYTNSSSNITGGSVIRIPSGYSVVVNFAFGYRSTSSGYAGFFAGPNYDALKESNSSRSINGSFTIPAGTKDFGIGFSFSSYNGTFTLIHPHISYTFVKNSMVDLHSTDLGNASGTYHNATYMDVTGVPDTEYVVSYSGSYDGDNHHTFHFTAESNSSGVLNISLSDVNFLGELAVFKADYPAAFNSGNSIGKIQFLNGGSTIVMNEVSSRYIVISYSPDYSWKSSGGLKFVGVNAFGQQVFEVPSNGNYSIYIPGADLHNYSDWATALFMNVGFPTLLIIGIYRRRKASKNVHRT